MKRGDQIAEIRKVYDGLIKDVIPEDVPKNRYIDAENINLTPNSNASKGGATPALGNDIVFEKKDIEFTSNGEDYKGFRIAFNISAPGISHSFTIKDSTGSTVAAFSISSALLTPQLRYDDLKAQLEAFSATFEVYIDNPLIETDPPDVAWVGFKITGLDYTVEESIAGTEQEIHVIKEFYGIDANGIFQPLKSLNIGNNLYIISSNGAAINLGVAVKDETDGTWSYTTVLQTKQIVVPDDLLIDLDGQIDFGNRVSLYWTGKPYIPRAFYVTLVDPWEEDYAMIFNENQDYIQEGNPNGHYTYENIEQNTRVQILENFATVTLSSVNNTGGTLPTASNRYAVRQVASSNSSTGFSIVSNPIPIFTDPLTDQRLSGNIGGITTSKSVTLTVSNLNPEAYSEFDLVVIQNIDGAMTFKVVGTYPITGTSVSVTHTGSEITTDITAAELITAQVVFKTAGNLVINRNRLFLSDIETAEIPDYSEWAQSIAVTTQRDTLSAIGTTYSNVGEYQVPNNVASSLGYMLEETYRFAIMVFYKSGVIAPYFVKDHTFTFADGSLTTGSGDTPDAIYAYYPQFSVDLSTADPLDGVPFEEAIFGYSIVRLECIPEILGDGMILPQTATNGSRYGVGEGVVHPTTATYTRTRGAFLCPDILFDQQSIGPLSGDQILNYGQPANYNSVQETRVSGTTDYCNLVEYNGVVGTYETVEIENGETVDFDSFSLTTMDGLIYSTDVNPTIIPTQADGFFNQKSIGLFVSDDINVITAEQDDGFYRAKYKRALANKYGDTNEGAYLSCGHFRLIETGTSSYTEDVFGGDTFTQKNFIKFCNHKKYIINDDWRVGVTFYSQNRANTQLRYFADDAPFLDYPYTTTSLVTWLSGATTSANDLYAGTLTYSTSYTPINQFQLFQGFDPDLPVQSAQTNTMYYSQLKIEGSLGDNYRIFLPLDNKSYPLIYGAIKNTFRSGNNIIIMQEQAVLAQQLDQQQQQNDPNGVTIIIGDGTVLGARESILSLIGAPIKTGALQYLSTRGGVYICWYNPSYKKLFRLAGDGIRDLGEENLMQSLLTGNGDYLGAERSVVIGYDFYTNEVVVATMAEVPNSTLFNMDDTYAEGTIVYTGGFFTTPKYYRARKGIGTVPAGKDPSLPANQLQYWEKYRNSNYTLSFNESTNQFSSFYTYTPVMFMPYKNTFLSFPDSDGLRLNIYEHNLMTGSFYADPIIAYITLVFNDLPNIFKTSIVSWFICPFAPIYLHFRGINGSKTYSEPSDILQRRDYWWSNVKNDAAITASNTTGLNDMHTQKVGAETSELTVFFENEDAEVNTLDEISMKSVLKPRNFFI